MEQTKNTNGDLVKKWLPWKYDVQIVGTFFFEK
jgi:hypothetical protein